VAQKLVKKLIPKEEINLGGRWLTVHSANEDPDNPGQWKIVHGHGVLMKDPDETIEWRKPEMT
jgi:hypothetical protein